MGLLIARTIIKKTLYHASSSWMAFTQCTHVYNSLHGFVALRPNGLMIDP